MNRDDWYKDLSVERVHHPDGRLKHIDIIAPNAAGNRRRARVFPGTTNEFLADIIYGLQYELESRQENQRVNKELGLELH